MKSILTICTLLATHVAFAETTVSTPAAGAWTLKRGNTTVASATGPIGDCRARASADAESRSASATYTCTQPETLTVTYTVAPVQCSSTQPTSDTQQATCPSGSFGTFMQTRSYNANPSPTCWQPGAWAPTTAPAGACSTTAPSGTFVTTFDSSETPLSEGGAWRRSNNPWTNVKVQNGVAFGTNGVTNGYDDSYAYLTQNFGANYEIEGIVYRDPSLPSSDSNELELMLRVTDSGSTASAYEVLWQSYGGQQIVKWNGPFGSFTVLQATQLSYFNRPLANGDVLKASVIGNVITMYVNGVATQRATDSGLTSGQPGIGFFRRPGESTTGIGWTQIKVTGR